ncbi:MAG: sialate O-acetylesterase [Planctomycetes bacterium]|nr:sialate O-acetylesterase [Planctomycetota bacterium]
MAPAQLSLAPMLGDHMVLQREREIVLWGTAAPRAQVVVALGQERREVVAAEDGSWRTELAARPASATPFSIRIASGAEVVELADVVVGDVWICAGQSNMEFPIDRDLHGEEVLSRAPWPGIRCYQARYTATGAGGAWDDATVARLDESSFAVGDWSRCSVASLRTMSAVGFYCGRALHEQLGVPIGLIDLAAGGSPTEAWIPRDALRAEPATRSMVEPGNWLENPELGDWCRERAKQNLARALERGLDIPGDDLGPNHAFKPGFLWRTAIEPATRLRVRGVLWYQGESNAESPRRVVQHGSLFPLLVASWRRGFGEPELPFLFVQLPAMGRPDWPAFREQQRLLAAELVHVGMAVTIDVGHPTDVHPPDKRPVGERLAALAMSLAYGAPTPATGPRIVDAQRVGNTIVLRFEATDGGLDTSDDAAPLGFAIVDAEGESHPAAARIDGDTVVLDIPGTVTPARVAHGWAPVPTCNLVDGAGLPASPFRVPIGR